MGVDVSPIQNGSDRRDGSGTVSQSGFVRKDRFFSHVKSAVCMN
jgi:hypothetical protein